MTAADASRRDVDTRVSELLAAARSEPRRVLEMGPSVIDDLTATGDAAALSMAWRAMGLAARWAGTVTESIGYLHSAIAAAEQAHSDTLAVEAQLTLSGSQAIAGEMSGALDTLSSIETADDALRARIDFQLGSIYARMARPAAALQAWGSALPVFRQMGDAMREAMTLKNRGLLNAFSGDLDDAQTELTRAAELFRSLDVATEVAAVDHNLGIVALYRGDIPAALRSFDESEARLVDLTGAAFEVRVSHCEALLSAGLYTDAVRMAKDVCHLMHEAGLEADAAEATLVLGAAALAAGDRETARRAADDAVALFERQGRSGWAAHARYTALRARYGQAAATKRAHAEARRIAASLDAAGQYIPASGARLIAGRLAIDRNDIDEARIDLGAVAANNRRGPIELTIQAWLAKALLHRAEGDLRRADAAAQAGVRALGRFQGSLGATDVRVGIVDHARELGALGLSLAADARSDDRLLRWMERTRATATRLRPVTPPVDADLASATAELRRVSDAIRTAEVAAIPKLRRRQVQLQREISSRSRHVAASHASEVESVLGLADLSPLVGDTILVEMAMIGETLHALKVEGGSTVRHRHDLAADVMGEVDSLRLIMRRSARTGDFGASNEVVQHIASTIDRELIGALDLDRGPVVIIPPAPMFAVPWSLLPSCQNRPVVVAPSATTWARSMAAPSTGGGVVLVAGPRLEHASHEVRRVAKLYPGARRFNSRQAYVDEVLSAMDGAALAHFACHASFNADNPMFSALHLTDGDVTVYDLERLETTPRVVVLSACESGISAARPGDELLGLATAFHSLGTRSLIASVGLVPDSSATQSFMMRLHHELVSGKGTAHALMTARLAARSDAESLTAASFVCFGAG